MNCLQRLTGLDSLRRSCCFWRLSNLRRWRLAGGNGLLGDFEIFTAWIYFLTAFCFLDQLLFPWFHASLLKSWHKISPSSLSCFFSVLGHNSNDKKVTTNTRISYQTESSRNQTRQTTRRYPKPGYGEGVCLCGAQCSGSWGRRILSRRPAWATKWTLRNLYTKWKRNTPCPHTNTTLKVEGKVMFYGGGNMTRIESGFRLEEALIDSTKLQVVKTHRE